MPDTEIIDIGPGDVEEVRNLPAVRASEAIIARGELSVDEVVAQKDKILQVMQRVMKDGVHYGLIPGVSKPSLLKAGAEAINVALRLAPHYESEKIWHDDGHLTVITKCELHHIPTDLIVGTGEGLCTTRETRYAYRQGGRTCPACGAEGTIKRSKYPPRDGDYPDARQSDAPGWYCFGKIGGCGANFAFTDKVITDQPDATRVDNPDLPDTFNTVLKMSAKRSLTSAVLNATAASDIFTVDVEDQGRTAADTHEVEVEVEVEEELINDDDVDPGTNLLSNAMRSNDVKALYQTMQSLNDSFDWGGIIATTLHAQYGAKSREELTQADRNQWWLRLRNAVAKAEAEAAEISGEKASSPEQIASAFVWAFPKWDGTIPEPEAKDAGGEEEDKPSDAALTPDQQKQLEESQAADSDIGF